VWGVGNGKNEEPLKERRDSHALALDHLEYSGYIESA